MQPTSMESQADVSIYISVPFHTYVVFYEQAVQLRSLNNAGLYRLT